MFSDSSIEGEIYDILQGGGLKKKIVKDRVLLGNPHGSGERSKLSG